MGHEFTGTVTHTGTRVEKIQPGDLVVCPFTVSCGECFYCAHGFSSRCSKSLAFGSSQLDGAQAEYVRVPLADTTVVKAPTSIDPIKLCLMADIFPTGYFAAYNALGKVEGHLTRDSVVVLLGCGPVGICALVAALEYQPKAILAVDSITSRLETAKRLGAEPWNYQTQREGIFDRVHELTNGRGADQVIEVVGHSSALELGFQLLRPWGTISSVGVHNGRIPWTGNQAYEKNLAVTMGRCPVRSMPLPKLKTASIFLTFDTGIFQDALNLLEKKQHLFE